MTAADDPRRRWRVTVRADAPARIELRGYVDADGAQLTALADALDGVALVIASPAEVGYDPFAPLPRAGL